MRTARWATSIAGGRLEPGLNGTTRATNVAMSKHNYVLEIGERPPGPDGKLPLASLPGSGDRVHGQIDWSCGVGGLGVFRRSYWRRGPARDFACPPVAG